MVLLRLSGVIHALRWLGLSNAGVRQVPQGDIGEIHGTHSECCLRNMVCSKRLVAQGERQVDTKYEQGWVGYYPGH